MEDMKWLLDVIQETVTVPLCLYSPDPKVLEMAYQMVKVKTHDQFHQPGKGTVCRHGPFPEGKRV